MWDRSQSLGEYGSSLSVDYLLVIGQGTSTRGQVSTEIRRGLGLPNARRKRAEKRQITLSGKANQPFGVAGLSGFSLRSTTNGPTPGRYLRRFTVDPREESYDPNTGQYQSEISLAFANAGPFNQPLRVEATATYTLVQFDEGIAASHHWDFQGESQEGRAMIRNGSVSPSP